MADEKGWLEKRSKLTLRDVAEVVGEMREKGMTVSLRNVRGVLGRGSFSTISNFLRELRGAEPPAPGARLRLAEVETELERSRKRIIELEELLEREIDAHKATLDKANKLEAKVAVLGDARGDATRARERAAVAEAKATELGKRLKEQKSELDKVNSLFAELKEDKGHLSAMYKSRENQIAEAKKAAAEARIELGKSLELVARMRREVEPLKRLVERYRIEGERHKESHKKYYEKCQRLENVIEMAGVQHLLHDTNTKTAPSEDDCEVGSDDD
jgi:DNA repair exonuclease SbcCD ATPase subunit